MYQIIKNYSTQNTRNLQPHSSDDYILFLVGCVTRVDEASEPLQSAQQLPS